jgi:hypothetical protein
VKVHAGSMPRPFYDSEFKKNGLNWIEKVCKMRNYINKNESFDQLKYSGPAGDDPFHFEFHSEVI